MASTWTYRRHVPTGGTGLGNRTGRRIIDESQSPDGLTLRWMDRLARHTLEMRKDTDAGREKRKRVLANLSRQTSLEFRRERRKVAIWFVARDGKSL